MLGFSLILDNTIWGTVAMNCTRHILCVPPFSFTTFLQESSTLPFYNWGLWDQVGHATCSRSQGEVYRLTVYLKCMISLTYKGEGNKHYDHQVIQFRSGLVLGKMPRGLHQRNVTCCQSHFWQENHWGGCWQIRPTSHHPPSGTERLHWSHPSSYVTTSAASDIRILGQFHRFH